MENSAMGRLAEQMDRQTRVLRKQLFWSRIFALCCVAAVVLALVFLLPVVTQARNVLESLESYTEPVDAVTDELAGITETLGVISRELRNVDYEEVVDNLVKTSEALGSIDWVTIADDLTKISSQLSQIDWQQLAADVDETAIAATNGMEQTLEMLSSIDLDTLNQAIADLQTVVRPLAQMVERLS